MLLSDRAGFLIGRLLQYGGQAILVLLLPLVLVPAQFALLQLLLPVTYLVATFAGGWLAASAARYVHATPSSAEGRVLPVVWRAHALLLLGCIVAAVTLSLLASSSDSWLPARAQAGADAYSAPFTAAAALLVAAGLLKTLTQSVLNSGGNARVFAVASAGLALSPLLLIAALWQSTAVDSALLSFALCDVVVSVLSLRWHGLARPWWPRRAGGWSTDVDALRQCLRYGGPVMLAGLGSWVIAWSDRYVLSFWVDAHEVGRYVQSYQLSASIITIPLSFVVTLLVPRALALERDNGLAVALQYVQTMQQRYRWIALPFGVLATVCVVLLQRYFYTDYALPPMLIAGLVAAHLLLGYTHFQNKRFELSGRTAELMRSVFVGAAANVVGNMLLVPPFGAAGAAWSTLVAYGVTVGWLRWRSPDGASATRISAGAGPPLRSHL